MITLQKVGDALKFTFTDNPLYLQNGTIEVPVNSLTLVTDNSGIATFKKSASNDIFVCASYDELGMSKAELETWFKENAVGGVGIESGDVQTMINQSISGMADNASYDSVSQEIKFYNGNTEVYSVDASDFVIDGMIDDVRIETISGVTYLVIDFNTASGKQDIQIPLTDIFDPSNYYTKAEIDAFSGEVESAITEMSEVTARALVDLEDNKQDKLSAGTGINIDSANTISCTVTPSTYSAGRGISISNNTISTDLNVYSGQGVASVSLCNPSGTGNGESSIDGMASVGGGFRVTTKNYAETAFGTNNQSNGLSTSMTLSSGATLFSVGNGTGNTKHNAFEIRQNGDIYITSGNSDIKLQDNLGSSIEVSSAITSGDTNPVEGGVLYDTFEHFEGFNPIADTVTLEMGQNNTGRNYTGIGYGVLNYNTFNPITNTTTSGNTADVFKFSVIDFKGENNILKFNGSAIDSNKLKGRSPFVSVTSFTDGYSASTSQYDKMFSYETCLVLATNAEFTGFMYDNVSINISGPNGKSGRISFEGMGGTSIDIYVNYNGHSIIKTISPLVLGSSYIIDLRDAGWGDEVGIHTLTVSNWDSDTFISSMKFYSTTNATTPIADIASDVAAGVYATTAEMFDELSHVVKKEEVNFYEYGSPSAVTISTGFTTIYDFYGIVISGMSSTFSISVKTDDASGNSVDTLGFNLEGSITSQKFPHEPIPYYLDDELTKFDNGVWNIYFAEGTKVNYLSMSTSTVASAVIYKSLTETPIKDAISGKVDTSSVVTAVTSGSTDSEIPSAKAVYDQLGGLKLQQISQADYDALVSGGTVDNSTLYIITNVVN